MNVSGMVQDKVPAHINLTEGEYFYAKNIVLSSLQNVIQNENGTIFLTDIKEPDKKKHVLGVIPCGQDFVIFSGNSGTNTVVGTEFAESEIGVYNHLTQSYFKIDLTGYSDKLKFHIDYPIKGVSVKNYKLQTIIAWTDNYNVPRMVNINYLNDTDTTILFSPQIVDVNNINDFSLFRDSNTCNISCNVSNNGSLLSGTYYITYAYQDSNGAITNYFNWSKPVWVYNITSYGDNTNKNTGQAINIQFDNVDLRYSKLILVAIYKSNGVYKTYKVKTIDITSSVVITEFTGNETLIEMTLDEILIQAVTYKTSKTIEAYNDRLYLGNLTTEKEENLQRYANDIVLGYEVNEISNTLSDVARNKSFQHGEVYAFYIRFVKKDGSFTNAYHIPAPDKPSVLSFIPTAIQLDYGFSTPVRRCWVSDNSTNLSANTGTLGTYYSEEQYPIELSSDIPVGTGHIRLHRFPDLNTLVSRHSFSSGIGSTTLPSLHLTVNNVTIPTGYSGYEILYAKRNYNNCTVFGVDYLMLQGVPNYTDNLHSGNAGNFQYTHSSGSLQSLINDKKVRLHSFNLLNDKPSLGSTYIQPELQIELPNLNTIFSSGSSVIDAQGYVLDGGINGLQDVTGIGLHFYNNSSVNHSVLPFYCHNISEFKYLPNSVIDGTDNNYVNEDVLLVTTNAQNSLFVIPVSIQFQSYFDDPTILTTTYQTQYITIKKLNTSCYQSIFNQDLVSNGIISDTSTTVLQGIGDCFIGKTQYICQTGMQEVNSNYPPINGFYTAFSHVGIFPNNVELRYEDSSYETKLPYSKNQNLNYDFRALLENIERTKNNTTIRYNKDYNDLNIYKSTLIYNGKNKNIDKFPYRIVRSNKQLKEQRDVQWQTFLANEYYELIKNKGFVTNLVAFGDRLLIHTQYGLFLTRDKLTLETDITKIRLGSGDIFEIEPQELFPNALYGGTHNQIANIVTKVGYFYVDVFQGKVFLFNNEIKEISNSGMKRYFADNLSIRYTLVKQEEQEIIVKKQCVNNIVQLIVAKSKGDIDIVPEIKTYSWGTVTQIEQKENNYVLTTDLIPDNATTISVLLKTVRRTHHIDYVDNPYKNRGFTSVFDEVNNRYILTKKNHPVYLPPCFPETEDSYAMAYYPEEIRGIVYENSSVASCYFNEGDLVLWVDTQGNVTYRYISYENECEKLILL